MKHLQTFVLFFCCIAVSQAARRKREWCRPVDTETECHTGILGGSCHMHDGMCCCPPIFPGKREVGHCAMVWDWNCPPGCTMVTDCQDRCGAPGQYCCWCTSHGAQK
ncbi:tyrosine-protein kinase receptor Tie-1-like [Crassostrea angulata]|uniref:Uncharacterized protein n=1 Tax=Magallana gigas TaxID=29159 RepID=A0A8W8HUN7_MAGGI|nr:tyrosine-protein kinase receptor Tie-1 [Crassostrea gigas]XP_052701449.1 tyrosine-protein kinase receptor Tie-1-like [Crassostrea angulata]|eukprot:XP_011442045.1 PREDICTED: tyrosine-protein kinase receptor Tie-1 [Crassostrea gigas]